MKFKHTTAIKKIRRMRRKVKALQGGMSAGKTFGVLPILIDRAAKASRLDPLEISVVAESFPVLRRGAIRDFKKIMKATGRWVESRWNKTESTYTFLNGSYIEFFSADDDSKLRGGRRHILYINEANNISFEAYMELAPRTHKEIFMDWNPVQPFWFHEKLQGDPDVDFAVLTYKDNESCPESEKAEILKNKEKAKTSAWFANWYKVYGLGQVGMLEGVIYDNWKEIKGVPPGARLMGYGMDFGFANDPNAVVAIYLWEGKIVIDEIMYQKGLVNSVIAKKIRTAPNFKSWGKIVADSSEPKTIAELKLHGLLMKSVSDKSVVWGISVVQEYEILITQSSTNVIKEIRAYSWDKDKKTGELINSPVDYNNHAMDAMRYGVTELIGKKGDEVSISANTK